MADNPIKKKVSNEERKLKLRYNAQIKARKLGKVFKNARKLDKRWSVAKMAEEAAICKDYIYELEAGTRLMSVTELIRLSDALGYTIELHPPKKKKDGKKPNKNTTTT